jgi:hypothetical protein
MTGTDWIILIVAVVILAAVIVAAVIAAKKNRTKSLKNRFGPEYDRAVSSARGDRSRAESDLSDRTQRHRNLHLRPLDQSVRQKYLDAWNDVEQRFVDIPGTAVADAGRLVDSVMTECGYPEGDTDHRADDLSVDHPDVALDYRRAKALSGGSRASADVSIDDMRDAMLRYRTVLMALVGAGDSRTAGAA